MLQVLWCPCFVWTSLVYFDARCTCGDVFSQGKERLLRPGVHQCSSQLKPWMLSSETETTAHLVFNPGGKRPRNIFSFFRLWRCTRSRVRLWARRKPRPTAGGPLPPRGRGPAAAAQQCASGPGPGPAQAQAARAAPAARVRAGAAPCWPPAGSGARLPPARSPSFVASPGRPQGRLPASLLGPQPGAARSSGTVCFVLGHLSCWGR